MWFLNYNVFCDFFGADCLLLRCDGWSRYSFLWWACAAGRHMGLPLHTNATIPLLSGLFGKDRTRMVLFFECVIKINIEFFFEITLTWKANR